MSVTKAVLLHNTPPELIMGLVFIFIGIVIIYALFKAIGWLNDYTKSKNEYKFFITLGWCLFTIWNIVGIILTSIYLSLEIRLKELKLKNNSIPITLTQNEKLELINVSDTMSSILIPIWIFDIPAVLLGIILFIYVYISNN